MPRGSTSWRRSTTNRQALVDSLLGLYPADLEEREDVERMLRFAEDLGEPFSREQLPAHFTASAAVVDPARGLVCLVDHAKLGRRLQPGGHVEDGDEGPAEAALREVREETGLDARLHPFAPRPFDVDVHEFPELGDQPAHLHLDLRYLVLAEGDPAEGAHWLPFDEALAASGEPALRRLLEKARSLTEPQHSSP